MRGLKGKITGIQLNFVLLPFLSEYYLFDVERKGLSKGRIIDWWTFSVSLSGIPKEDISTRL